MNTFEQELRKLFGDGQLIDSPAFSGRSCFGTLGRDLRVRVQFFSTYISNQYDALKLTVMNRTEGPVDTQVLKFKDLLGKKSVPNNPNFRDGVTPHLWDDYGKVEWYAYRPTTTDYQEIRQAAAQYLDVFRDQGIERGHEHGHNSSKLVYICAPLRGEADKNIAFARQKAAEVFAAGDIPVCPHLMFPPSSSQSPLHSVSAYGENSVRSLAPPLPTRPASLGSRGGPRNPENPVQDQQAREAGLRLVEACQQLSVYGTVRTDGMRAEIRHAEKLGIPVMAEQKTIGRSQPQRKAQQKGKGAR